MPNKMPRLKEFILRGRLSDDNLIKSLKESTPLVISVSPLVHSRRRPVEKVRCRLIKFCRLPKEGLTVLKLKFPSGHIFEGVISSERRRGGYGILKG